MSRVGRHMPWQPVQDRLDALLDAFSDGVPGRAADSCYPTSRRALADRIAISRRTIERWVIDGVPIDATDELACATGRLPYELWPDLADEMVAEFERVCADPACVTRFVPPERRPDKKYCSRSCQQRTSMHDRYYRDRDRLVAKQRDRDRARAAERRAA